MRIKQISADILFIIQFICAILFGGSQFLQMFSTTEGVNISIFICWQVFFVLNLVLSVKAHKAQPSRVTLQTILSYSIWILMVSLDLIVILIKSSNTWNDRDTFSVLIVSTGSTIVFLLSYYKKVSINDPIIKGYLALLFKATPQFVLAYNIFLLGGSGLSVIAIISGHITIFMRLGQLYFSIKEAGWDKNRIGSAISEFGNETSWIIVTFVWLLI